MHRAFLWCFDGDTDGTATEGSALVDAFAAGVVAAVLPVLDPAPG